MVGGFETEAAVGVVLLGFLSRLQQKTPTNKQDFLGGLWDFLAWRVVFLPVLILQKSNCTH